MPFFGKKSAASKAGGSPEAAAAASASTKKAPTVEDKYTMKDVLGTYVQKFVIVISKKNY